MKKHFTFSTGEHLEADLEDLQRLLRDNQQYYENYQDVLGSLEDDDYVARGNGFCDRKYSDDFIEGQEMDYPMGIILEKFADNGKKSSVICLNLPLSAKIQPFSEFLRFFLPIP